MAIVRSSLDNLRLQPLPENAAVYLGLGTVYGMMGQNEKAIRYFEQSAALDPNNRTTWKNLGVAYRSVGNIPKAEECERKAQ